MLALFYVMFYLQPNVWQSTRIATLSLHTTQSYDKTIGNFDALAKITGSFAPEGNDALIFRESVLTSWVNIAIAVTCISSTIRAQNWTCTAGPAWGNNKNCPKFSLEFSVL